MSEPKGIGLAGLALLPIVCCVGLPLLLAAAVSDLAIDAQTRRDVPRAA